MTNSAAAIIPFPAASPRAELPYYDAPACAKLAKQTLTKTFPGVKFKATSSRYAGGSSVRVYWTDGPTTKQVEAIIGGWHCYDFDGMTDSTIVRGAQEVPGLGKVDFGNGYIFAERTHSAELKARVKRYAERKYSPSCWDGKLNHGSCWDLDNFVYRLCVRATLVNGVLLVKKDNIY
jgi:hypothetical protein